MIDRIRTRYGPLVRGWGDATPATKNDVAVRVDGVPVVVSDVNPYTGEIFLAVPLAPAAPGTRTVEIDYIWLMNPVFVMSGLNTPGLTLNTWDRAIGHSPTGPSPIPATSTGAAKTNRFPMGIVLGPSLNRGSPQRVGHKYIGFQRGYSALLNTPSTLLLNQNPNVFSVGGLSAGSLREVGTFSGNLAPSSEATPWSLIGADTGALVGDGSYRVVDASAGPYGVGTAAVYYRNLDLSLTTNVTSAARFYVESYTADGVFTGVGFGVHDGLHLLLVGCLIVGGMQHVGVLLDGANPHLEASWKIGPALTVEADSQTTFLVPVGDLPRGVASGTRFRVASGTQAGIYTVTDCGLEISEDGAEIEVTITPALPADVTRFGNTSFEILFETPWDADLLSFRSSTVFTSGATEVYLGSSISGLIASVSELPPYPAQTALLLPATEKGVAFWGSISTRVLSSSIWDFSQYASNPQRLTQTAQGISVAAEMSALPQDEVSDPWYVVGGFGYSTVDVSGTRVLLKSTSGSADATIDEEFSYERVEPFLTTKVSTNTEAIFRVESGILGAGDAEIRVRDSVRSASLRTLLYVETASARALVTDLPQESLSGLQDPVAAGWAKAVGNTVPDPFVRGQTLQFTKSTTQAGLWSSPSLVTPVSVTYEGVILEARLAVTSATVGSLGNGFTFGCNIPINSTTIRAMRVAFGTGTILLLDGALATVASFAFNWNDGAQHTYRLSCDPNANIIVLTIDDVVIGNTPVAGFASSLSTPFVFLGGMGTGVCEVTLDSLSLAPLRPTALPATVLGRTFGILLKIGDPDDINSYKIPRDDGTSASNSSLVCTPVQMDWQAYCQVRFYLDPTWGVSFYRPDLAAPPWYTGNFATDTTDPTAAWATVEYRQLPVFKDVRGSVTFGALDPRSVTQQRWNYLKYRIRGSSRDFGIAPQGMVLNRATTLASGEYNRDVTPEVVTVNSRTSTTVYVPDSAIYADRIFIVQVDAVVLASTAWTFDKTTQVLTLVTPLAEGQYPVTVTFAPAKPVTKTYLEGQSIEETVTVLNEGTPPVPWSRTLPSTRTVVVDGNYEYLQWTDGAEALYSDFQKIATVDGESVHITPMCDGPGPGQGFAEIGIAGEFTSDTFTLPGGPGGPLGSQSAVIAGSAGHFNSAYVLTLSGGARLGLNIGMAGAILHPIARGPSGTPPPGGMGMNQDFRLVLEDVTPRAESFLMQSVLGDNVPPASATPISDTVLDGTPGIEGHGACAYTLENFDGTTSRIGPWGGLAVLSMNSLLAGGSQLSGSQFVLSGGTAIAGPTVTTGSIEAAN